MSDETAQATPPEDLREQTLSPKEIAENAVDQAGYAIPIKDCEVLGKAHLDLLAKWDALDEPTEEMIEAGDDLFPWPMSEVVERKNIPTSLAVFKAMIAKAKE